MKPCKWLDICATQEIARARGEPGIGLHEGDVPDLKLFARHTYVCKQYNLTRSLREHHFESYQLP